MSGYRWAQSRFNNVHSARHGNFYLQAWRNEQGGFDAKLKDDDSRMGYFWENLATLAEAKYSVEVKLHELLQAEPLLADAP